MDSLEKQIETIFELKKPTHLCFRDKRLIEKIAIKKQAETLCTLSKRHSVIFIMHAHLTLAKELEFAGIHLTSNQLHLIRESKEAGLSVFCSTHTQDEIEYCQKEGADAVTFSPIFSTPGKGLPLGAEKLKETVSTYSIPIIALGGVIAESQIELITQAGAAGFASIRYFFK